MAGLDFGWDDLIAESLRCAAATFGGVDLGQMSGLPWKAYCAVLREASKIARGSDGG